MALALIAQAFAAKHRAHILNFDVEGRLVTLHGYNGQKAGLYVPVGASNPTEDFFRPMLNNMMRNY